MSAGEPAAAALEDALNLRSAELRQTMMAFFDEMKRANRMRAIADPTKPAGAFDVSFNQAFHAWTVQHLAALQLSVEALTRAVNHLSGAKP